MNKLVGFIGTVIIALMMMVCNAHAASTDSCYDLTSDTSLMLHGDGADTSTTITDESGKTATANGSSQIDTAQSKFGGSAIYFDGSSDNITFANDDDFKVNTGDFTIDFWVRWNGSVSSTIFSDMGDLLFALRWSNSATRWEPYMNGEPFGTSGTDSMSADTWYHIAWVRSGTTVYLFRNGTLIHSGSNNQNLAPTGTLYFGSRGNGSESMNGWIDEFRFTKGNAIWTGTFTAPTSAYTDCNAGGDTFTPKITWFN